MCPHLAGLDSGSLRFTRVQSTMCEQKLWDAVIMSLGPDLYWHLAQGSEVIVHDKSERDRETRACWQGLRLIRRACETVWHLPVTPVTGRGGHCMEQYMDAVIFQRHEHGLSDSTWTYLSYWSKAVVPDRCELVSCWGS